tara:strand:+ start:1094 stop:1279 length:186 start_codon:yes stop_codon:yes gene_type:complete
MAREIFCHGCDALIFLLQKLHELTATNPIEKFIEQKRVNHRLNHEMQDAKDITSGCIAQAA